MDFFVEEADPHGDITPPSCKSFSQRHVLLASLGHGKTTIRNVSGSDDEIVSIRMAEKMNTEVSYSREEVAISGEFREPGIINAGSSATSYRLCVGMLAGKSAAADFTGTAELSARPIAPLLTSLNTMGCDVTLKDDGFVKLVGARIATGPVTIESSISSQFLSSLIIASTVAEKHFPIIVNGELSSPGYVEITKNCLAEYGISVSVSEKTVNVTGELENKHRTIDVEADFSSAAFFIVLGLLKSTEGLRIRGLKRKSLQPDSSILEILGDYLEITGPGGEKIDVVCRKSPLKKIVVDAAKNPDLAPPLSVVGIFSDPGVEIKNVERLRFKESDRFSSIVSLCEMFGAKVSMDRGNLRIKRGRMNKNQKKIDFHDHRMIMAAAVAASANGGGCWISNREMAGKSYPMFFEHLAAVQ